VFRIVLPYPLFTALGYVRNAVVLLIANGVYLVCWLLTTALGLAGLAIASGVQLILVIGESDVRYRGKAGRGPHHPDAEIRTQPQDHCHDPFQGIGCDRVRQIARHLDKSKYDY
jgi:hypothetical protein